jgi:acyl-CoA thioester hydrolase
LVNADADFGNAVEVWRGGVNTWECDEMGHLNVRFYVARAAEGLVGLASALGMSGAFRPNAESTLVVKDHHIRFMREARPGAALHMMAGVLEFGETDARLFQLLVHSLTGEIAACFQTLVSHVSAQDLRPFPWARRIRATAQGLMVQVPAGAAPRSLDLAPAVASPSISEADRLGLIRIGSGAVAPADCDVFGRMRPDFFIGRVSDGITALRAALRGAGPSPGEARRVGGAVLEYRIAYLAWPTAGARFELRSGLAEVGDRTQRFVHWMLDPDSGRAWGSSAAVAISLDLEARKIVPIAPEDRALLERRVTSGLAF